MRSAPLILTSAPRFLLRPDLCLVASLTALVATVSFSGQSSSGGGRSPHELLIHSSRIEAVAYAPGGSTAASTGRDGTVKLWDVSDRRELGIVHRGKAGCSSLAFSPDGRTLAVAELDGKLDLLDLETGTVLAVPASSPVALRAVVFSPDGTSLAVGGDDRSVRILDPASGRVKYNLSGHTEAVHGLAFSPDGSELASVGFDGQVVRWDADSGRVLGLFFAESGPLWSVAYANDGHSLALGGTTGLEIRDLSTDRSRRWESHRGPVTTVRYLPGGLTLASSSLEGAIVLWDVSRERFGPRGGLNGQTSRVSTLAVSPDGGTIVTGSDDSVLRFWELTHDGPTASGRLQDGIDRCFTPCNVKVFNPLAAR
jgi:WD40 repeat protein